MLHFLSSDSDKACSTEHRILDVQCRLYWTVMCVKSISNNGNITEGLLSQDFGLGKTNMHVKNKTNK